MKPIEQLLKKKRNQFQMSMFKIQDIFNLKFLLVVVIANLVSCGPNFKVLMLDNPRKFIALDSLAREDPAELARINYGIDEKKILVVFETSMYGDTVSVIDIDGPVFNDVITYLSTAFPLNIGYTELKINNNKYEIPRDMWRRYKYLLVAKKYKTKNKYILTYTNILPSYY